MMKHIRLPNTFVLLFAILAMIALSTRLVPGGKYDTHMVNGRALVDPASFHHIASSPQGPVALIIGFLLIVGGAFAVLQKTEAIASR
jgi:uncharacterized ion transporter superfamily protein YfcC